MDSQKQVLQKLKQLTGPKTLDQFSQITGIERTRFFRLQQGYEMKLSEFEKILFVIKKYDEDWSPLGTSSHQFDEENLKGDLGRELWERMDRLVRYKKLLESSFQFVS